MRDCDKELAEIKKKINSSDIDGALSIAERLYNRTNANCVSTLIYKINVYQDVAEGTLTYIRFQLFAVTCLLAVMLLMLFQSVTNATVIPDSLFWIFFYVLVGLFGIGIIGVIIRRLYEDSLLHTCEEHIIDAVDTCIATDFSEF